MRTGSKHLHSLVNGGALLPVATERRRNALKRGGAAGPKVDSRKAGVCRVIHGRICHGCGALRVIRKVRERSTTRPTMDHLGHILHIGLLISISFSLLLLPFFRHFHLSGCMLEGECWSISYIPYLVLFDYLIIATSHTSFYLGLLSDLLSILQDWL